MTDFNKRVEFQLSCQWTDVTTLLIVWVVISIVLKEKKVKKNNRVDTIIQDIRVLEYLVWVRLSKKKNADAAEI